MPSIVRLANLGSGALRNKFAYGWFIRSVQFVLMAVCGVTAFMLRFDFALPPTMRTPMMWGLGCWILVKVPVFHACGLGKGVWRYFTVPDLKRVATANLRASAAAAAMILLTGPGPFPRSVLAID